MFRNMLMFIRFLRTQSIKRAKRYIKTKKKGGKNIYLQYSSMHFKSSSGLKGLSIHFTKNSLLSSGKSPTHTIGTTECLTYLGSVFTVLQKS